MWDFCCLMGNCPSVAPIPRSLPQKPFGASSANSTIVCPLWSGNPRSFIIVYFWVSSHTDAISPRPIVDLPLPGGGGLSPSPSPPQQTQPSTPQGVWMMGRGGVYSNAASGRKYRRRAISCPWLITPLQPVSPLQYN